VLRSALATFNEKQLISVEHKPSTFATSENAQAGSIVHGVFDVTMGIVVYHQDIKLRDIPR
jgi:hypothetical protein